MKWQPKGHLYKYALLQPFHLYNANPYTWKDNLYIETGPRVISLLHYPIEICSWMCCPEIIFSPQSVQYSCTLMGPLQLWSILSLAHAVIGLHFTPNGIRFHKKYSGKSITDTVYQQIISAPGNEKATAGHLHESDTSIFLRLSFKHHGTKVGMRFLIDPSHDDSAPQQITWEHGTADVGGEIKELYPIGSKDFVLAPRNFLIAVKK